MPNVDKPTALQQVAIPTTLGEILAALVGQPVVVYLKGVHAKLFMTNGMMSLEALAAWCPPRPGPGPCPPVPEPFPPMPPLPPMPPPCPPTPAPQPMMGTAVVTGVVAAAGADYVVLQVACGPNMIRAIYIPFTAIGMVIPAAPA